MSRIGICEPPCVGKRRSGNKVPSPDLCTRVACETQVARLRHRAAAVTSAAIVTWSVRLPRRCPDRDKKPLTALRDDLEDRRKEAFQRAQSAVATARFRVLVLNLVQWIESVERRLHPAAGLLQRSLAPDRPSPQCPSPRRPARRCDRL